MQLPQGSLKAVIGYFQVVACSEFDKWWVLIAVRVDARAYATRDEAALGIFEHIEIVCNRARVHSALGYMGPAEFEEANWSDDEGRPRLRRRRQWNRGRFNPGRRADVSRVSARLGDEVAVECLLALELVL